MAMATDGTSVTASLAVRFLGILFQHELRHHNFGFAPLLTNRSIFLQLSFFKREKDRKIRDSLNNNPRDSLKSLPVLS